ncbi:hypothetical protein D3C72_1565490 [compost metagenome]
MRRKPSASHCVKKVPWLTYRPMSCVFLAGQQVVKISSAKGSLPSGKFSSTRRAPSILNEVPWPLTSTRAKFRSSPSSLSGCAATSGLRRSVMRLSTRVLFGSRSKVSSTLSIQ